MAEQRVAVTIRRKGNHRRVDIAFEDGSEKNISLAGDATNPNDQDKFNELADIVPGLHALDTDVSQAGSQRKGSEVSSASNLFAVPDDALSALRRFRLRYSNSADIVLSSERRVMDLDVTITRSGEAGKQRRVELACHVEKGVQHVMLSGSTTSGSMTRQFVWFADTLMPDADLRMLDHEAFQAWQQAGGGANNTESASRRWPISQDQLLDLLLHLLLHLSMEIEKGNEVLSSSFEPYEEKS